MITKPVLLLDEQKCKANINAMVAMAKKNNLTFRPHFKTHQSLEIGRWFKEVGVSKITVSSLEMANYFAQEWQNITVAFPVNILEIKTIIELSKKIQLNLLIESVDTIEFLKSHLIEPVGFFIKINIGNQRTGILPDDYECIDSILKVEKNVPTLNFLGFLGHAGQTYQCRNTEEIDAVHNQAKQQLVLLKEKYIFDYPDLILSYGDTPSCSIAEDFQGLDEIRPGNFVFYDIMQEQIGSCDFNKIAVAMACPIVSIHKERSEIVIYGGGIHLSKDRIVLKDKSISFGQVVNKSSNGWSSIIEGMYLRSLSQEHGVVIVPENLIEHYRIGELLYVLPVHSCMTANLMKRYKTTDNNTILMMNN